MKKHLDVVYKFAAIAIIIFLVLGIAKLHPKFLLSVRRLESPEADIYRSIIAFGIILIGVMMEYKRIVEGFKTGFKIKWVSFAFSLLLVLILFIPFNTGLKITGIRWYHVILHDGLFRSIISIIGGICLVRSITKGQYNNRQIWNYSPIKFDVACHKLYNIH